MEKLISIELGIIATVCLMFLVFYIEQRFEKVFRRCKRNNFYKNLPQREDLSTLIVANYYMWELQETKPDEIDILLDHYREYSDKLEELIAPQAKELWETEGTYATYEKVAEIVKKKNLEV